MHLPPRAPALVLSLILSLFYHVPIHCPPCKQYSTLEVLKHFKRTKITAISKWTIFVLINQAIKKTSKPPLKKKTQFWWLYESHYNKSIHKQAWLKSLSANYKANPRLYTQHKIAETKNNFSTSLVTSTFPVGRSIRIASIVCFCS